MQVPLLAHRRFVDFYFLARGNLSRAAEMAGLTLRAATDIVRRPEIQQLIEQRQADLSAAVMAGATEVVGVLVQQMRADIADAMPDEPILQAAKAAGVSRLIKKIKVKEGKDGARQVELELYSAQAAAQTLAKIFGLESQDDLQRARDAIKLYCEMKGCGPEVAIVALAPHVPAVLKVKDEFLRPAELPAASIEGEVAPANAAADAAADAPANAPAADSAPAWAADPAQGAGLDADRNAGARTGAANANANADADGNADAKESGSEPGPGR
jgi:phage terminase small subunit